MTHSTLGSSIRNSARRMLCELVLSMLPPSSHLDLPDLADGALANQVARLEPGGVVRTLEGDDQLDAVALAGRQHGVRLAQVDRHRFLAQDGFRSARRRGDDHLGVLLVPRAHVHEVGLLGVEHLAEVGVALVLGDAEEVAEFAARVRMGVGAARRSRPAARAHPARRGRGRGRWCRRQ